MWFRHTAIVSAELVVCHSSIDPHSAKPSTRDLRTELRQRIREITPTRILYGYRRVHITLKREGWQVGKNVVYRVYREEGLCLRSKRPRRRKMVAHREARCQPKRPNEA